jgi:hypothetical protein
MGIHAEELQAKRLLASFDRFRGREKKPLPPIQDSARRWMSETYQRIMNMIPIELRGFVEPAQMFHEILEHRWYLGERQGKDPGLTFAAEDYIRSILPHRAGIGAQP